MAGETTVMFADVEGSTPLLAELGAERYEVVLDVILSALRDHVAAAGGELVRLDGDGVLALFSTVAAAIEAAIGAQRHLTEHPPPFGLRPKLRVGVHHGEVRRRPDGDVLGMGVHQAARVVAAANGGQVLLSSAAAETIDGATATATAADVELVDLGAHHVRDFEGPERLHLVRSVDVPFVTSALRVPAATPHHVPPPRYELVGRSDDVEQLVKLIGRSRLVTLLGPGGVGKTRLAVEVARLCTAMFDGGVWLVDLTAVPDDAHVDQQVALVIGATPGDDLRQAVVDRVRGAPMLIVLDNCEHLLEGVAGLVDALLDIEDGPVVLATTRERLAVRGEEIWRLGPLALPPDDEHAEAATAAAPAVRLLAERVAALDRGHVGPTPAALAEIARLVDGLPLALELVAARLVEQPAAEVAADLRTALADLVGGYRGDAPRQRGLRALVAATYDRLPPDEQQAFRRAGVLLAAVPAALAAAVVGGGDSREGGVLLDRLVERSLIEPVGDDERRVLEPLREVALDALRSEGEEEAIRSVHASTFAGVAKEAVGAYRPSAEAPWLGVPPGVLANIRVALQWTFDHQPEAAIDFASDAASIGARSGLGLEARAWSQRSLDLLAAGDPRRLLSLVNLAQMASTMGDVHTSQRHWDALEEGIAAGGQDATVFQGHLLVGRGSQAMVTGEVERACEYFLEGIPLLVDHGYQSQATQARNALAGAFTMSGRPDDALAQLAVAVEEATALGDPHLLAMLQLQAGIIRGITGDDAGAAASCARAVESFRGLGDTNVTGLAVFNLGTALSNIGQEAEAAVHLQDAVGIARRLGDRRLLVLTLQALAQLGTALSQAEAEAALTEAAATAELAGLATEAAKARAALAAHRCSAEPDHAVAASTGRDVADAGADRLAVVSVLASAARAWAPVDVRRAAWLLGAHRSQAAAAGASPQPLTAVEAAVEGAGLSAEIDRGGRLPADALASVAAGEGEPPAD